MAMDKDQMAQKVFDKVKAAGLITDAGETHFKLWWSAIADGIIDHITNNAVVSTTVATAIPCSVDPVTHIGATTSTGSGSGTVA